MYTASGTILEGLEPLKCLVIEDELAIEGDWIEEHAKPLNYSAEVVRRVAAITRAVRKWKAEEERVQRARWHAGRPRASRAGDDNLVSMGGNE